jgi:Fic family protein
MQALIGHVDEMYQSDAYHSLSIEGSSVTPEVIEKVRKGNWSPEADGEDRKSGDALAGYRNIPVHLRNSRYAPLRWEAVRDAMPVLFELLEQETEPGVRAVLGHRLFGYTHPYADGNGRMARFLMNVMLASGGYPWTVRTC